MDVTPTFFELRETLRRAERPALLCSFGKESLVLLDMVRQIRPETTIIHFYDHLSPEVVEIFKGWNLEILSWRPAAWYLVPDGDHVTLVSEYSFGDARLPVLRDVVEGEDCQWEKRPTGLTESFDYPFDVTIWGYRHEDELHQVMLEPFHRQFQLGMTKLVSPLYWWKTEDVLKAVSRLPDAPVKQDAVRMCAKCKEGLRDWDRQASLEFFDRRFNNREAA